MNRIFGIDKKYLLISIVFIAFVFAVINVYAMYQIVGKTFSGFGIEVSLAKSPGTETYWTGSVIPDYDKVVAINGTKIKNIEQFKEIISSFPPDTSVDYTILGETTYHKTIKTMEFTYSDFIEKPFMMFLACIFFLLLALITIIKAKEEDYSNIFSIFCIFFALSYSSFYEMDHIHNLSTIGLIFQNFTISSLIYLGLIMNKHNIKKISYKTINKLNFIFSSSLSFSLVIMIHLMKNDIDFNSTFFKIYDFIYSSFVFYIASTFLIFVGLCLYANLKSPVHSLERYQSRVILTGSIFSFLPYIFLWFIPYLFKYNNSYSFGLLTFSLFPFFVGYSIIRYKAFDIEFFIRKSLIYTALSSTLLLGYFSVSTIIYFLSSSIMPLNKEIYIALSAILATMFTSKFNKKIQEAIDKTFYRQKYDLSFIFEGFIQKLKNILDMNELVKASFEYLEKSVNPQNFAIYSLATTGNFELVSSKQDIFPKNIKLENESENVETILSKYIEKKDDDDCLIIPLKKEEELIGLLYLSKKMSDIEYFHEEKYYLNNFASALSITLNNILVSEEVTDLTTKNAELESKAQFLNNLTANLSHDLKFPINSASLILSRIKYKMSKGKGLEPEAMNKELDKLSKTFGKINEYINICLDQELISLNKLKIANEKVDIKLAVRESLAIHADYLERKEIELSCELPEEELFILGDRIRFEHIISNLISNAAKYGGSNIDIKVEKKVDKVFISVADNGPGVSEKVRNKVFERYTLENKESNSGKERSTGLGLFICKNYIELMKGDIRFETETDKGTTFYIELPIMVNEENLSNNKTYSLATKKIA